MSWISAFYWPTSCDLIHCTSGRPLSCSKTSVQRTITLVFVILASLSMKTSVFVRCVPVFNFWERASEACSFSQYWKRGRFGSLSSTNATWVGYTSSEPRALRSRGIPFVQSTAPHVGLCCAGGRQIAWLRTRGCKETVRTETYIVYVRISCICQILSYVSVLVPHLRTDEKFASTSVVVRYEYTRIRTT